MRHQPSVLILNSVSFHSVASSVRRQEAFYAGEDVVGGLGPAERRWIFVGRLDIVFDRVFEVADRAEHTALEGALGEEREEAFGLIEPGGRGRRVMHVPARPLQEPVADQLGLMGSVIVHDDVNVEIGGHVVLDLVEELSKLLGAMPTHAGAHDRAGLHVERGEQRRGSMALVVMGAPLDPPRPHGQQRLRSVKRLHLAFLIDAQYEGTLRR